MILVRSVFAMLPGVLLLLPILVEAIPQQSIGILAVDQIQINRVSTSGSGCPRRAVSITISEDKTVVTLGFDEYQTHIGRGSASSEKEKNCRIKLNVKYPGGYTYAVVQTTYHGYAQLDNGVTGTFTSEYAFGDNESAPANTTNQATLTGGGALEEGQVYTKTDVVPTTKRVRAPCGRNVNLIIRTRISLSSTNATAGGSLTDDDATIAFTNQINLGWEACTE